MGTTALPLSLTHAAASQRTADLHIQARDSRLARMAVRRQRRFTIAFTIAPPRRYAATCPTC